MDSTLRTIVYVSTATMPLEGASIEALMVESRDLNLGTATTGVLLLSGGSFMQCIEGRGVGFDETWDRIRLSRRHTQVTVMVNDQIDERSFPDWQMGCFGPGNEGLLAQSTERWKLDSLLRRDGCSLGLELLQQFWKNAR